MSTNNEIEKAAAKQKQKTGITKEYLEQRLKELQEQENKGIVLIEQTQLNVANIRGAMLLLQEQLQILAEAEKE